MPEAKGICKKHIRIGMILLITAIWLLTCSGITASAEQITHEAGTWSALREAINNAEAGDTVTLTADVTAGAADTALVIPDGAVLTLDLNGHTIDRAMTEPGRNEGSAIFVLSGAMLTVTDSSPDHTGKITGGQSPEGGGINNSGALIIEGGCITGNFADDGGGVINYGELIIKGGTITGNSAVVEGGGIYNAVKGYISLDKSAVYGNSAPNGADIKNTGSVKYVGGETVDFIAVSKVLSMVTVLPALVLLSVLFIAVRLDNYLSCRQKRIMYSITILVLILVLQNYFDTWLYQHGKWIMLRTISSIIGYTVRPAILALFLHIISPDSSYKPVWIAVGANAAFYLTALFSPLTFSYSSYGHFLPGPLNPVCLLLSGILFLYCIYKTIRVFRPRERKETWIPILALVLISLSVVLDYTAVYTEAPVSFLTMAITICSIMYYIWLHLQFVREHERALQAEHRIQIMMTQIQPHFMFNTLTAIRALCISDSAAAVRTIGLFSTYLRQNLRSLDQSELIPLAKEMEHTRIYTEIEMIRFPNIHIEYDIEDEEYGVPALTVQPLVENAVRHGVRSREEGIIKVKAFREKDTHIIVIKDNGTGFDEHSADNTDGTHIGISNVRERLEQMCHGTMEIDSRPGDGTRIVLRIPANKE